MPMPPTITLQDFLSKRLEARIGEMQKVLGYLQSTGDWRTARMISQSIRECEAAQRIVEEHGGRPPFHVDPCDAHDADFETVPCDTLRYLAAAYVDRADYREEWKP